MLNSRVQKLDKPHLYAIRLQVSYYGNRKGGPAERIVKVPRSGSPAGFKRLAREALADDDIAGEPVKKARLRWTFTDG
jgi:hypothetical protein